MTKETRKTDKYILVRVPLKLVLQRKPIHPQEVMEVLPLHQQQMDSRNPGYLLNLQIINKRSKSNNEFIFEADYQNSRLNMITHTNKNKIIPAIAVVASTHSSTISFQTLQFEDYVQHGCEALKQGIRVNKLSKDRPCISKIRKKQHVAEGKKVHFSHITWLQNI